MTISQFFSDLSQKSISEVVLTEDLGDVAVVHVWAGLEDLPALVLGPDHEGVHRPLDVRTALLVLARLPDYLGPEHFGCGKK